MRWNKINDHWECVFVNVPFKVILVDKTGFIKATLLFTEKDFWIKEITTKTYPSVEVAKSEVESFILDHLAQYSAQVYHECLQDKIMTWRRLKEQLDQIPEDQLDDKINHLDPDGYWVGEPRIELAEKDFYMGINGVNYSGSDLEDQDLVVEKGKYFLSTCNV